MYRLCASASLPASYFHGSHARQQPDAVARIVPALFSFTLVHRFWFCSATTDGHIYKVIRLYKIHCDPQHVYDEGESCVIFIRKMYNFKQFNIVYNYFYAFEQVAEWSHNVILCRQKINFRLNSAVAPTCKTFGQNAATFWSNSKEM